MTLIIIRGVNHQSQGIQPVDPPVHLKINDSIEHQTYFSLYKQSLYEHLLEEGHCFGEQKQVLKVKLCLAFTAK